MAPKASDFGPPITGIYDFGQVLKVTVTRHEAYGVWCRTEAGDEALIRIMHVCDADRIVVADFPLVDEAIEAVVVHVGATEMTLSSRESWLEAAKAGNFVEFVRPYFDSPEVG